MKNRATLVEIDDYVSGYEIYGSDNNIQIVKGWIDELYYNADNELKSIAIQADDNYKGYRGTTIHLELGQIILISKNYPRIKTYV